MYFGEIKNNLVQDLLFVTSPKASFLFLFEKRFLQIKYFDKASPLKFCHFCQPLSLIQVSDRYHVGCCCECFFRQSKRQYIIFIFYFLLLSFVLFYVMQDWTFSQSSVICFSYLFFYFSTQLNTDVHILLK